MCHSSANCARILPLVLSLFWLICSVLATEWVVRIKDDGPNLAQQIAEQNGFENLGPLSAAFPDLYVFREKAHHGRVKREIDADERDHSELVNDVRIEWSEQQVELLRDKRGFLPLSAPPGPPPPGPPQWEPPLADDESFMEGLIRNHYPRMIHGARRFSDQLFPYQWYLAPSPNSPRQLGQASNMRIAEAWDMNVTGLGVKVAVLDDGLEHGHSDIYDNYDPYGSFDTVDMDSDPTPRYSDDNSNSHGTKCAGEIAMGANNRKCGVGVAYRAKVGGIRCLDGRITDRTESIALTHNLSHVDIYSASWGPQDNGQSLDGPKALASAALLKGVTEGRGGLGVIYVWAAGNGGITGDNCNCDGYVSSIYTIAIGAATRTGAFPWYSERCASVHAVAYSSGTHSDPKIITTDLRDRCTLEHTGTSAAAPLATGIIALTLEANPKLSWRDMQYLITETSDFTPLAGNKGWKRNGGGYLYNSRFGFGMMNAASLVRRARTWKTVPPKQICRIESPVKWPMPVAAGSPSFITFKSDGCSNRVVRLEHVQVELTMDHTYRGAVDMYLKSPAGSITMLLSRRHKDRSTRGFQGWNFTSVHLWGERTVGRWTLMIRDKGFFGAQRGQIRRASLLLHGPSEVPSHMRKIKQYGPRQETMIERILDPVEEYDENDFFDQSSFAPSFETTPVSIDALGGDDEDMLTTAASDVESWMEPADAPSPIESENGLSPGVVSKRPTKYTKVPHGSNKIPTE